MTIQEAIRYARGMVSEVDMLPEEKDAILALIDYASGPDTLPEMEAGYPAESRLEAADPLSSGAWTTMHCPVR